MKNQKYQVSEYIAITPKIKNKKQYLNRVINYFLRNYNIINRAAWDLIILEDTVDINIFNGESNYIGYDWLENKLWIVDTLHSVLSFKNPKEIKLNFKVKLYNHEDKQI